MDERGWKQFWTFWYLCVLGPRLSSVLYCLCGTPYKLILDRLLELTTMKAWAMSWAIVLKPELSRVAQPDQWSVFMYIQNTLGWFALYFTEWILVINWSSLSKLIRLTVSIDFSGLYNLAEKESDPLVSSCCHSRLSWWEKRWTCVSILILYYLQLSRYESGPFTVNSVRSHLLASQLQSFFQFGMFFYSWLYRLCLKL